MSLLLLLVVSVIIVIVISRSSSSSSSSSGSGSGSGSSGSGSGSSSIILVELRDRPVLLLAVDVVLAQADHQGLAAGLLYKLYIYIYISIHIYIYIYVNFLFRIISYLFFLSNVALCYFFFVFSSFLFDLAAGLEPPADDDVGAGVGDAGQHDLVDLLFSIFLSLLLFIQSSFLFCFS